MDCGRLGVVSYMVVPFSNLVVKVLAVAPDTGNMEVDVSETFMAVPVSACQDVSMSRSPLCSRRAWTGSTTVS